ncbi:unnamed protein product [Paramecium sonneborni]|uniref:TRAFD1/XAF1 zinc finger domain-containing protein n=1 Tax=Paramecium sonneborni TaxID=65129 RepID=A0A8S1QG07_9CILI|nr:unnamed protein product [Paramecium sonneborni]
MSETKVCQCCLEEVLSSNYLLHSLYCERNIVKCEICDKRMDMIEKDSHMETHQKTDCPYCQQKFEQGLLEMHKKNCSNKPEKCGFCDLMINMREIPKHQANCGSRTEQCQICKKHIQKREMNFHLSICETEDKQQSPKRNRLKRNTNDNTFKLSSDDDASVQEIKQLPRRKPQKQIKQQSKQKEQVLKKYDEDDDEDFQKALQMSLNQK